MENLENKDIMEEKELSKNNLETVSGGTGTVNENEKCYAHLNSDRCLMCGTCVDCCDYGAIYVTKDDNYSVNITICTGCGKCANECPTEAIKMIEI